MNIRRSLLGAAAVLTALLLMVSVSLIYSRFASRQIYRESVSHLEEIYSQLNSTFRATITKNWRLLRGWSPYVAMAAETDPEALQAFLQQEQKDWHFSGFYFLAPDGSYCTETGETGVLELGRELERLMEAGENLAAEGTLPSGEAASLFAIPAEPGQYRGFAYTAIGIGFDAGGMAKSLQIQAYAGRSRCVVTDGEGRVLFSSQEAGEKPVNFLEEFRRWNTLSAEE